MRIWSVGILFVVAAFLYLYKGFTPFENYALNVAGVCALGVALVPMPWNRPQCSNVNPMEHWRSCSFSALRTSR